MRIPLSKIHKLECYQLLKQGIVIEDFSGVYKQINTFFVEETD